MPDKKERTRYCESAIYLEGSCEVGWGRIESSSDGQVIYKNCHDEPKEQNCLCLVNKPQRSEGK